MSLPAAITLFRATQLAIVANGEQLAGSHGLPSEQRCSVAGLCCLWLSILQLGGPVALVLADNDALRDHKLRGSCPLHGTANRLVAVGVRDVDLTVHQALDQRGRSIGQHKPGIRTAQQVECVDPPNSEVVADVWDAELAPHLQVELLVRDHDRVIKRYGLGD